MLIFKKEKKVRKLILNHVNVVQECLLTSQKVVDAHLSDNADDVRTEAERVVSLESEADLLKREIQAALLDGAYLPNIRSDIHRLVKSVDSIAGKSEDVANFILDQSPMVPEPFKSPMRELFQGSFECFTEMRKAQRDFFKPKGKIDELHEHVNQTLTIESQVDKLQASLSFDVFSSSLELAEKIHIQQLINHIGNIADLSESAADELEHAAMKSVL